MKFAWTMVLLATAWPQPRWLASNTHRLSSSNYMHSTEGLLCSAQETSMLGFGTRRVDEQNTAHDVAETGDSDIVHELPAPKSIDLATEGLDTLTHKLEVGGPSLAMPDLGPIIVNTDGTLRRIENWSQLTKAEQASTIRMVTRRNKKRLDALKELEAEGVTAGEL